MANMLALGGGILTIIVGGVLLLVGTQVFASLDNNFNCSSITNGNGTNACNNVKTNVWLILSIAPYGLVFTGIFLIFGSIIGKF